MQEWNPKERDLLSQQQDAADNLPLILARAVLRARGAISAGGYALGPVGTIPDQIRDSVIAFARWKILLSIPEVESSLLSKARADDYKEACDRFVTISKQGEAIEPADDSAAAAPAGNWNSENKVIMKGHPVPRPSAQAPLTSQGPPYANPDAAAPVDD